MFKGGVVRGTVFLMVLLFVLLCAQRCLFAQNNFFPRGVYSEMNTLHLDSLDQMQRAGFNIIIAGLWVTPDEDLLIEAAARDMKVSFDGGDYIHSYSSAQYNVYEAELEQSEVPNPFFPDRFYWYAHETGREDPNFPVNDGSWYARPDSFSAGYLLEGPYDAYSLLNPNLPDTTGLWHEKMIGQNGTDFEAAYRLRMGAVGQTDPATPVADLRVDIWVSYGNNPPHFKTVVDSTLTVADFTVDVWDVFRVEYHMADSEIEKFARHNLYWHGTRELWVDWVEVKDVDFGVPLFAGTVDNNIIDEANFFNSVPAAGTLFRWYLWDEPRRVQYRAQNYVDQLLQSAVNPVRGMTVFAIPGGQDF